MQLPEENQLVADNKAISGTYDESAAKLSEFADVGVTNVSVIFSPVASVETIKQFARVLKLIERTWAANPTFTSLGMSSLFRWVCQSNF